jgi:hypothetical protein
MAKDAVVSHAQKNQSRFSLALDKSCCIAMAAGSLFAFAQNAGAVTLDFNNTVDTGQSSFVGPSVSVSGFSFVALNSSEIFLLDPAYSGDETATPDNSDFFSAEEGTPTALRLTSDNPTFSLQSFRATAMYGSPEGNLTVIGNLPGGGVATQVFALPAANQPPCSPLPDCNGPTWNTYTLDPIFTNVTSVTFEWPEIAIGLDNIQVDSAASSTIASVPVMPLGLLSVSGGLLGLIGLRQLRR